MPDTSNIMIPAKVHDVLLHTKESDKDVTMFPFTRYENVFNSPKVISDIFESTGAPFVLYENETVDLSVEEIRELCGNIL